MSNVLINSDFRDITQQHGDKSAPVIYTLGQERTAEQLIDLNQIEWLIMKTHRKMNAPEMYEICVAGHLSANWARRFEGLSMRHLPEGETVLSGLLDQAALHGVLMKIRDLGLKLISVKYISDDNYV